MSLRSEHWHFDRAEGEWRNPFLSDFGETDLWTSLCSAQDDIFILRTLPETPGVIFLLHCFASCAKLNPPKKKEVFLWKALHLLVRL
jgi:hypothetical protein